jgi:signal transduction histidine kinase
MGWLASSDVSSRRSAIRTWLVQAAIVFLAYYLAGKLGQASAERSSNLGPLWPAYGVALAALIRLGPRMIPAVMAAAFLVAAQSPVPLVGAAGQAVAATTAAFSGSWLLARLGFDYALPRLRDALHLVVVGAFLSPMVSATLGTSVLTLGGIEPYSNYCSAWTIYWMGDGAGVLLATPLALSIGKPLPTGRTKAGFARLTEYLALNLLLLLPCLAIFGDLGLIAVGQDTLTFSVLPFIMWAAIRFGLLGASLSTILVATIATLATAAGNGPFARSATFVNAALLDVFYAVLAVTGIMLAALIAERARAEAERDALIREQAAAQARAEAEKEASILRDELAHMGRVEMLNALSSAIAHEINQPLAAIRLNTETATFFLHKQPVPAAELGAVLNDIREDGKRAGDVLKQARELLRKEAASHQAMDLNAAVQDVARLVQYGASRKGVQVTLHLGAHPAPISGDRVQIQQVVMNLLMNACEAVEKRDTQFRHVRLTTSFEGDMAGVSVTDQGLGIAEEEMKRLFEPFYTTKQGGMGLGLAICRSIVHAHKGRLTVRKNSEGGLTFLAEFPFAAPAAQMADTEEQVRLNA